MRTVKMKESQCGGHHFINQFESFFFMSKGTRFLSLCVPDT